MEADVQTEDGALGRVQQRAKGVQESVGSAFRNHGRSLILDVTRKRCNSSGILLENQSVTTAHNQKQER